MFRAMETGLLAHSDFHGCFFAPEVLVIHETKFGPFTCGNQLRLHEEDDLVDTLLVWNEA